MPYTPPFLDSPNWGWAPWLRMLCSSKGGFKEPGMPWDPYSDPGLCLSVCNQNGYTHWLPYAQAICQHTWWGRPSIQTYLTSTTLEIPGMPSSRQGSQESHGLPWGLILDLGMLSFQVSNLNLCHVRLTLGSIPRLRRGLWGIHPRAKRGLLVFSLSWFSSVLDSFSRWETDNQFLDRCP